MPQQPSGLAIVGTLRTENLGIERIIRNVLANPHIRFLVVCGEDTRQAIGHLPGQSLASLFANGTDERGRIRGAPGKRPILQNVTADQVGAFRRQVELVALIGEQHEETILRAIETSQARNPGAFADPVGESPITTVHARDPDRLIPDPAGFFVVYPDARRQRLVVEHYTVAAVLDCIIEGASPAAIAAEAIERGLLTRLDHAAYLGRELALADRSLKSGERYVQDRAPGEPAVGRPGACGCEVGNGDRASKSVGHDQARDAADLPGDQAPRPRSDRAAHGRGHDPPDGQAGQGVPGRAARPSIPGASRGDRPDLAANLDRGSLAS